MARIKPDKKSKRKANGASTLSPEMAAPLLTQATTLLHSGQPEEALPIAQKALQCLSQPSDPTIAQLPALELLGEISIELGDTATARSMFLSAVAADPNSTGIGMAGGAADKFLWLAQLSEEGGEESVEWFGKGAEVLRRELAEIEGRTLDEEGEVLVATKRVKLANALCGAAEVYMTDLSWDVDAEAKCEALVTEACVVCPDSPEPLQTLASVRISQLRHEDARSALTRSLEMWIDLEPEDPLIPEYPTRISLARLLMEIAMEDKALDVLERLVAEDDTSVEAWYLGGWCLHLLAGKQAATSGQVADGAVSERTRIFKISRDWLVRCTKLYALLDYEDERLKEHADQLLNELDELLGPQPEDDAEEEFEGWDDDDDGEAGSEDEVMNGT